MIFNRFVRQIVHCFQACIESGFPSSLVRLHRIGFLIFPALILAAATMPVTGWWRTMTQSPNIRVTPSPSSTVVQRLFTLALDQH